MIKQHPGGIDVRRRRVILAAAQGLGSNVVGRAESIPRFCQVADDMGSGVIRKMSCQSKVRQLHRAIAPD